MKFITKKTRNIIILAAVVGVLFLSLTLNLVMTCMVKEQTPTSSRCEYVGTSPAARVENKGGGLGMTSMQRGRW